jgi:hypothetical protein
MAAETPDAARRLAGRLAEAFERDQKLAEAQTDALGRLRAANDELWSGVHPDALGLLYDDAPAAGIGEQGQVRSRVTAVLADARHAGADEHQVETVVLQAVQEIHWAIHRALSDYQSVSEDRRHLAAEVGELAAGMVSELVAAGWSETDARAADVQQLAGAGAAR